ncbi:MAG: trypsin-like peptidase domain-containing protein [Lachnospiraceae bacterium]|nr:trypsin-like peptidase domain-containing protein [Lachnospiraceae bacterium]
MKRRTLIPLLCAGVLAAGAFTGLTGFADKENNEAADNTDGGYTLLTAADVDGTEVKADGTITGVSDVAAAVMPAVVSITNKSVTEVQDIFSQFGIYGYGYGRQPKTYEYESVSAGSGIIIGKSDTELLICTNNHVVEDATELSVGFVDDEVCEAVVKGTDPSNDLAVVAVAIEDIPGDTLDAIRIAEIGNSDNLLVGEQVVAIGNALGYGQSVTTGIVSALNRTIDLDGYNAELIQTDAAINPGNSGGALLDMNGHVIGINSAKAASNGVEGMGYAIPISYAEPILEDLMNKKTRTETVAEDESAYIGISGQGVSDEMTTLYGIPKGIYVTDVQEDSPAEEAGIKKGDVIVKFDGSGVTSMSGLKDMLAYYAAGETVTVTISE